MSTAKADRCNVLCCSKANRNQSSSLPTAIPTPSKASSESIASGTLSVPKAVRNCFVKTLCRSLTVVCPRAICCSCSS